MSGRVVQVPFHGRATRAWVLGATEDVPERILGVRKLVSAVRSFDERSLALYRAMSERYVAPLATVIGRAVPPRVASEELARAGARQPRAQRSAGAGSVHPVAGYREGPRLLDALRGGDGAFVVRPAPADEAGVAVACVGATLAAGRTAIVIVPGRRPGPGDRGGDRRRVRRRRGAVPRGRQARPVPDLARDRRRPLSGRRGDASRGVRAARRTSGSLYVHREGHPQHRDERSPSYHVRDVAADARRGSRAPSASSRAFCPSLEATAREHVLVEPAGRPWAAGRGGPTRAGGAVAPARCARSEPRTRAFVFEPLRGYGVARVCRSCGEPAACAACLGMLRLERGSIRCVVCEAPGRCASCGATDFGIARRGAERVEEWARGVATVPVSLIGRDDPPRRAARTRDRGGRRRRVEGRRCAGAGPRRDPARRRVAAPAGCGRPRAGARDVVRGGGVGRTPTAASSCRPRRPNDPAIQALVIGTTRAVPPRRGAAPGRGRVRRWGRRCSASPAAPSSNASWRRSRRGRCSRRASQGRRYAWSRSTEDVVPGFGAEMRRLAAAGVVTRVEAEPHL